MVSMMNIYDVVDAQYPRMRATEDLLPLYGTARIPASSVKTGTTAEPSWEVWRDNGAGSSGVYAYAFPPNAEKEAFLTITLPDAWIPQTPIGVEIHWTGKTSEIGGKVCWGLEFTAAMCGDVFPTTIITHANTPICNGDIVAYTHYVTKFTAFPTVSTTPPLISARLFRDISDTVLPDTYTYDAIFLEGDLTYQIKHYHEYETLATHLVDESLNYLVDSNYDHLVLDTIP